MRNVYIIGAHTLKFGNYLDKTYEQLVGMTVPYAMQDAGVAIKDIEAVHFGNCCMGYFANQHLIRGQVMMRRHGFYDIPINNHESACATGSLTLYSAWKDILTGLFDCVLCVGVEKLMNEDMKKTIKGFQLGCDLTEGIEQAFALWEDIKKPLQLLFLKGKKKGCAVSLWISIATVLCGICSNTA